jgi:hypothetical protein
LLGTSGSSNNHNGGGFDSSNPSTTTSTNPVLVEKLSSLHKELPNPLLSRAPLTGEQRIRYETELESLLLTGKRDAALSLSLEKQDWPTAMMLAGTIGQDRYQEVMRIYASTCFSIAHPLYLSTMLFSGQAAKTLLTAATKSGPKFITTTTSASSAPASASKMNEEMSVFKNWKLSLAAIIANKTTTHTTHTTTTLGQHHAQAHTHHSAWEYPVQLLGYRLQSDFKNIFAAHFAYLCAGLLPADPRETAAGTPPTTGMIPNTESLGEQDLLSVRDFPLIGSSATWKGGRLMADCLSLTSLRMSEIMELALEKCLMSSSAHHHTAEAEKSSSSSSSGLFGFFSSSSKNKETESGSNTANKTATATNPPRSGDGSHNPQTTTHPSHAHSLHHTSVLLQEKLLRYRMLLCPFKVRLAMQLADLGLTAQANTYIHQALALIKEVHSLGKHAFLFIEGVLLLILFFLSEDPKSKKPKPNILPFAKKFLEAVDEIADRLGIKSLGTPLETVVGPSAIGSAGYSHGAAPPKAGSASGGGWGLSSVLSSQSLKDFIDGPQQQAQQQQHGPPAAPGVSAHPMMGGAPGAQDMYPAHQSQQQQQQQQQQNRPKPHPSRYHVPASFAQPAAPAAPAPAPASAPVPVPVQSSPTHKNMPPTNNASRPMSTPVVSSSGLPPMPFKVPPQQQQQQQQSTGFPPQPPGMAHQQQPPQQQQYPPQQHSHNPNNLMVDVDLGAGDDFQQNQQYQQQQQQQYPPYQQQQQQAQPPHQQQQQQQRPNLNQQQPAVQRWNPASAAAAPNPNMGPGPTSGGPNAYPNNNNNNNNMSNPSPKVAAAPWSMNPAMNPQQQQQQMQQSQNQQQQQQQQSNQFQQSTQQQPQQMQQQQQQAPTSQEGSSRGAVNQASPSNAAKTAAAANNNNNSSNLNAPTSGLLGSLRKGMIGWLYPDAKDASSNIGTSLEAFYDEKLGRWVFPGEVSALLLFIFYLILFLFLSFFSFFSLG